MRKEFPAFNCCKNGRNVQLLQQCITCSTSFGVKGAILPVRLSCKGGNDWNRSSFRFQVFKSVATLLSAGKISFGSPKETALRESLLNARTAFTGQESGRGIGSRSSRTRSKSSSYAVSPKEKEAESILERYFWARIEGA